MKTTLKLLLALPTVFLLLGCGITARSLSQDPGYASLHFPAFWQADKEMSVSVGPTLMRIARNFIDDDEEVSHLIRHVKGVHLRVYTVTDNAGVINEHIDESAEDLNRLGWERIVSVREDKEYTVIMVKLEDEIVQGLVVLTNDNQEAVFVNVIGSIEPASLQPLIAQVYEDMPEVTTHL